MIVVVVVLLQLRGTVMMMIQAVVLLVVVVVSTMMMMIMRSNNNMDSRRRRKIRRVRNTIVVDGQILMMLQVDRREVNATRTTNPLNLVMMMIGNDVTVLAVGENDRHNKTKMTDDDNETMVITDVNNTASMKTASKRPTELATKTITKQQRLH
jgi:hypothetical protein